MKQIEKQLKVIAESVLKATTVSEYYTIVANNDKRVNEGLTRAKSLFSDEEINAMSEYYCARKAYYSYTKAILLSKERENFQF